MNSDKSRFEIGELPPKNRPAFNVVLAYEDFSTGMHALRTFDNLFLDNNHRPCLDTHNVWKFDLLGIKKLREHAVKEAVEADMVIISAHGAGDLPRAAKLWMEDWVEGRRDTPGALVLLVDDAEREDPGQLLVETYVEKCAARARMDFFVQKVDGRHALLRPPFATNTRKDWQALEILTEVRPTVTESPGWGIND